MKPFKANALVLYYQVVLRHQPEKKILRSYFKCDMKNEKCDVVRLVTTIEPKIMAYLQAWQSV